MAVATGREHGEGTGAFFSTSPKPFNPFGL
jgi:hypothetical protein